MICLSVHMTRSVNFSYVINQSTHNLDCTHIVAFDVFSNFFVHLVRPCIDRTLTSYQGYYHRLLLFFKLYRIWPSESIMHEHSGIFNSIGHYFIYYGFIYVLDRWMLDSNSCVGEKSDDQHPAKDHGDDRFMFCNLLMLCSCK